MKPLEQIPQFPAEARRVLEGRFGIDSAESFYAHAVQNPDGIGQALGLPPPEVARLAALVEGHLPYDYVQRCHSPPERRSRGVILRR